VPETTPDWVEVSPTLANPVEPSEPCRSCDDTNKLTLPAKPAKAALSEAKLRAKAPSKVQERSPEPHLEPKTETSSQVDVPEATAVKETEPNAESLRRAMIEATHRSDVTAATAGFGSMEMLLRERQLARALTWVFPKIISADRAYWTLPQGRLGRLQFSIELSNEGRILATHFEGQKQAQTLIDLVTRMTRYLKPGRFEVSADLNGEQAVERRFEITVLHRKGQIVAQAEDPTESGNIERLGFDTKTATSPWRGYIVDTTGQEFVAELRELSPKTEKAF
jgi:hypothetical protein